MDKEVVGDEGKGGEGVRKKSNHLLDRFTKKESKNI